ncbi:UNVERIFIED_CONTAM: hypothetical protein Scaly_1359500 [Sesamum calycinum]|uniref:Carbohydrate kinase PfkB domain-containing protein n=1 Tax=Sesamum calycinum TaxID=2727403 RepID=A0AAW2PNU9_9LAMI
MALNNLRQVLNDEAAPVVIGGMVLDINATPSAVANPRTTTPGKLGAKPFMISAVGFDLAGSLLLEHWESEGLSVAGIQRKQDIETAVICHIFDGTGEVAAGVASVEAIEKFLTPEWIHNFKFNICSAPILMVDANLGPAALVACCKMAAECQTSVWFEPVSVTKSKRVASILKYITFTSPNEDELVAMANALSSGDKFLPIQRDCGSLKLSVDSLFQALKPAIWVLLEKVVRLTGAGDCLVGGAVASICAGLDIMQSLAVGIASAKGAVETETNVPAEYDLTKISDDAASVYSAAKVIFCESKL